MTTQARYVRCKVSPGLFDTEFYVVINGFSAYVDRSNVRVKDVPDQGQEVDGEVLAYFIGERQREVLIELPGEPVVGGLRGWVPKSQLVVPA